MERIEYYTIKPNLKQIYGKKVNKDTKFTEQTEDGRVKQTCENLVLTTNIKHEVERNGFTISEESVLTIKMPEGTILIWDENEGFIVPSCQVCSLEELGEEIRDIKEIYKPRETGVDNDSERDKN